MSVGLCLIIPEDKKKDKSIIDDYYFFVISKMNTIDPVFPIESYINSFYQGRLEWFDEKGYVFLSETVYSDIRHAWNYDYIDQLFKEKDAEGERIIYGDKIRGLIEHLKDVKEKLKSHRKKGDPDWVNWEGTMEPQVIALCEFALKNDFGIAYC